MGNFIKKRAIKLPVAVLVCAMLVIGGGLAYKAVALSGINITTPTEGVNWSGTKEITWGGDCATYPNVNIYYSTDGFAISSTKINTSGVISCSAGTYSWDTSTVDDGNQYQVKVRDSSDPDVFDTSGVFVIDNTAPAIQTNTLTSPNGGEFWAGGSPQDITWDSSDITDANLKTSPITLEYFNGAAWQTIATNEVNDGSYAWAVPNINSAPVKVKIIATDLAGNTASDESDAVFVIDSINPTATVTTSVNPIKIGALTQTVTVTYNESMAITTTPVIIIGSNWGTQTTGVWSTVGSITNNTYTTTLTHNGTAEEITNAVATVATASGATDLAGNSDIGDSSDVFVIDTKVPSVSTATANPDTAKAGTVTITVVFDENMDTVTSPTVQITGITGSPITVTQSSYANKTWIGIFTLADNNEKTTATISVTGAKDAAGNVMADNASAGTFVVDTVDPTVSLIAVDTNPIYDGDLIQKVVVIYNESMNTGTTPTITLTGSNWGTQVTGVWSQTNVANDTYTTTLTHNGTAEEIANAVATVATASGATDLAGNSDIGNSSAVFNIDTKNPTVDLSDDHADNIVRDADTVIITATFTEANGIDENPAPKITIGNVVTGAAMTKVDGTNLKWTYTWNVPADNNSTVNVSITATDNAGNPNEAATGETLYTFDNTAPTITVVLDDGDGYVNIVETGAGVNIIITTIGVEDGPTVFVPSFTLQVTVCPLTKTVSSNAVTIASGALTSLNDGTITATCDVSDIAGNLAVQASDTSVKDVVNPTATTAITYTSIYGIVVVDKVNTTNTNFTGGATITVGKATGGYAELLIGGVSFTTSIKDESIADADTAVIFDAGLSSNSAVQTQIAAGNQTLSVKLCDVAGNCTTSTDTKSITADYTVPTINSVALGNDEYVNAAEAGTGVNIIVNTTGVENGQTVTCGITDTSTTISSLTGVITNNTVTIASGALTSLNDGTITATCDVSDVAGNPAVQGSDTST
ncbi:hypothetical protein L6248_01245, partial [Candidatus Parcubacteria bacterium]|nr:hypothetical protein [Candidatus Parcubacteria bacterium]